MVFADHGPLFYVQVFTEFSDDAYSLWEVMQFRAANRAFVRQFALTLSLLRGWEYRGWQVSPLSFSVLHSEISAESPLSFSV